MYSFIDIRLVDIIDIVVSAYLMYALYRLIKGTMAASIVLSLLGFLLFWMVVRALNMSILSAALGSLVNIGLIALVVIFQQEIRTFLVMLSSRHTFLRKIGLGGVSADVDGGGSRQYVSVLVKSCEDMSASKTGALIVVARSVVLNDYIKTGEPINAGYSQMLIETIFFKNTPLHDGALIVDKQRLLAAGCILPVSQDMSVPKSFGLRHRSALGITEVTDAVSVVVSEETGAISVFEKGLYYPIDSASDLYDYLERI